MTDCVNHDRLKKLHPCNSCKHHSARNDLRTNKNRLHIIDIQAIGFLLVVRTGIEPVLPE